MEKEKIMALMSNFLIEKKLWNEFLEWAKQKGISIEDLAFPQ